MVVAVVVVCVRVNAGALLTHQVVLASPPQRVTQQDKVVHLPCSPSVAKILAAFVEEKKVQCGAETDAFRVWQEVAAGVRLYFERSLGTLLLYVLSPLRVPHCVDVARCCTDVVLWWVCPCFRYRSERTQFEQVRSDLEGPGKERSRKRRRSDAGASDSDSGESIADIYGATHLLRLFGTWACRVAVDGCQWGCSSCVPYRQ